MAPSRRRPQSRRAVIAPTRDVLPGDGRVAGDPTDGDAPQELAADRRAPQRRCIASGAVLPKAELIRFVAAPDGMITPDLAEDLPGRGMWVRADRAALDRAVARNLFSRAAKIQARVPEDLAGQVCALLRRRAVQTLGQARGAGQAIAGFEKVRGWLRQRQAALLLAACDGAADGRGKLAALAGPLPLIDLFDAAELGQAFGRPHVVHAALAAGGLARRLRVDARRLQGLQGLDRLSDERRPDGTTRQAGRLRGGAVYAAAESNDARS